MLIASFSSTLINTILIIALIWLVVLAVSLINLSRRKDVIMPVKIFWLAIMVFAPLAGLLAYLVYGPKKRNNKGIIKV